MRLSEFIQDTLYEIALGVHTARLKARNYVAINPASINGEPVGERSYIDFDVSIIVTETEGAERSGKGKLNAEINVATIAKIGASVGGEDKGSASTEAKQTHRVSFKVPVYLAATFRENAATEAEAATFLSDQLGPV
jgi:hypothetical protein